MGFAMEKMAKKLRATSALKHFIFTFHLEDGVAFGGQFECLATDKQHAWAILRQALPGAVEHVKVLAVTN